MTSVKSSSPMITARFLLGFNTWRHIIASAFLASNTIFRCSGFRAQVQGQGQGKGPSSSVCTRASSLRVRWFRSGKGHDGVTMRVTRGLRYDQGYVAIMVRIGSHWAFGMRLGLGLGLGIGLGVGVG